MKNAKHYFYALVVLLVSACSENLMNPIPTIEINPGFATPGFTDANLVSLNESDTKQVVYGRVYGISRELTMNLSVDEEALSKYNAENNTNYKLLTAEYYSMPENVTFEVKSKNANFDVKFNSKKLYESTGSVAAANGYVLPIKATPESTKGVADDEESNIILLSVNMKPATVSVYVPSEIINLDFVSGSEATEKITIEASVNFTQFDGSYLTLEVDKNADMSINGIDYELLPEKNYSFEAAEKNQFGEVVIKGEVYEEGLPGSGNFLLPCRIKSSNPHCMVEQSDLVYFAVNMTTLKVSIADADPSETKAAYSSVSTVKGAVDVLLNSLIPDDLTINFTYEPSLIGAFNAANGTAFKKLPDGTVQINNDKIYSGEKSGSFEYAIDISSLSLSVTDHYLVPFELKETALELGEISGSKVIYLDVAKTLAGTYDVTVIKSDRPRNLQNEIWHASDCERGSDWEEPMKKAQYLLGADGKWYGALFSVLDEDMPGMADCKKIEFYTFLELIEEFGGGNKVLNNNSYFNTKTGEVYIDCSVYESWFDDTYKETYSFKRFE